MSPESPTEPSAAGPDTAPPEAELFCPGCAYDLRGIADATRCPECGLPIDRASYSRPQIPWVHRRQIGRWRAYWRTVWLATWDPAALGAEAVKAVDFGDAQRFRLVTVFIASAGLIACFVAAWVAWGNTGFMSVLSPGVLQGMMFGGTRLGGSAPWLLDVLVPWEAGATWPPVTPLATFLALLMVSGVASYWFHPSDLPVVRQNRAVAISYYACAPLVFLPLPLGAFTAAGLMALAGLAEPTEIYGPFISALKFLSGVAGFMWLVVMWRTTLTLLSRATRASFGRLTAAAVTVPASWVACVAVALGAVPWAVGFLRLFLESLGE